jgi:hypothetical protein
MTATLTITTDNKWRDFVYRADVPKAILESDFDYQDEDEALDGFFKYRGVWYHLDMFTRLEGPWENGSLGAMGWHAYHGDSFYSGVVIKVSRDGERFKVGTYIA